jgi:gliding motility-associated-like protein
MSGNRNLNTEPSFTEKGVPDENANPGSRMLASGWIDKENSLWLFGGEGYGTAGGTSELNNVWKYNIANNTWTFVAGDASNKPSPVFGTRGQASQNNKPGGTSDAAGWKDKDGNFWIFGGHSADGYLNLTWQFAACTEELKGAITPASASICTDGSTVLTTTGGNRYQWLLNNEELKGETKATLTATKAGTYSVIIYKGSCSAPATNTATITVSEKPTGIRYADVMVDANKPTQLNARDAGVGFEWAPPTGLDNPSSATPVVTTDTNREYTVTITSENGCVTTDTVMVTVKGEVPGPMPPPATDKKLIAVPTAFTPDGNNVNDRLRPLGKISSIDYFRVFNRWGQMLYQTSVIGEGWDGRFKGVEQPSDTYTWLFSGKTTDGQPVKLSGKSILIR